MDSINKHTLNDISTVINKYLPNGTIIDPCSGNSFHTFLFNKFLNYNIITIDIQPENNAWVDTIEHDGLDYIKKWKIIVIKYYYCLGLIILIMNYLIIY